MVISEIAKEKTITNVKNIKKELKPCNGIDGCEYFMCTPAENEKLNKLNKINVIMPCLKILRAVDARF